MKVFQDKIFQLKDTKYQALLKNGGLQVYKKTILLILFLGFFFRTLP